MEILYLLLFGAFNLLCFAVGARVGQAAVRGEKILLPAVDPEARLRRRREKKEIQAEQDRMAAILRNIDRYDGTGAGQEDVR